MNEGPVATLLGLRGTPAVGESMMVERDVQLAELTGGRVHIAHLSTAASLDAVRRGKERGVRVTAEVTPHHLLLTDQAVKDMEYDTATKMNPPLRSEADRQALLDGLRGSDIDCIATDHAPHTVDDKKVEYDQAAFGIVGLETAVALCLDRLVGEGVIDLPRLVALLSTNPARVLAPARRHAGGGRAGRRDGPRPEAAPQGGPGALREQGPLHPLRRPEPERLAGDHDRGRTSRVERSQVN